MIEFVLRISDYIVGLIREIRGGGFLHGHVHSYSH